MADPKPDLRKPMADRLEAAKAAWKDWRDENPDLDSAWPIHLPFQHVVPFRSLIEDVSIAAELDGTAEAKATFERFTFERAAAQMLDPFWGWLECDAIVWSLNGQLIEQLSDWRKAT